MSLPVSEIWLGIYYIYLEVLEGVNTPTAPNPGVVQMPIKDLKNDEDRCNLVLNSLQDFQADITEFWSNFTYR